jgi:hypothetical protein
MSTVIANPAEMIAHGAPHVIHNDAELEAYTEALFQLTAVEDPSRSEGRGQQTGRDHFRIESLNLYNSVADGQSNKCTYTFFPLAVVRKDAMPCTGP